VSLVRSDVRREPRQSSVLQLFFGITMRRFFRRSTPPAFLRLMVAGALALPMAFAVAQTVAPSVKPGLWESKTKMSLPPELQQALAQAQQAMANLPPEQRKQMEAAMAQQGMSMSSGKDGEMTTRTCFTKEMAQRVAPGSRDPNCTYQDGPRVGNTQTFKVSCPGRGSGEGVVTYLAEDQVQTAMTMTSDQGPGGKPMTMKMEGTSRYLGSDCGNVKPLPMAK
jgi:hypothetical protein